VSTEENDFQNLFNILIESLTRFSIPYVLVGGSTVPYYGNIRTTQDIDTMVLLDEVKPEHLKDWLAYLKNKNLSLDIDEVISALNDNIHATIFDQHTFVFRIDLKKIFSDYDYLTYKFSRDVTLFGQKVQISCPESLIGIKMSDGFRSNTDIEDVLTIVETVDLNCEILSQFLNLGKSKDNLCELLSNHHTEACNALIQQINCSD
jgi:hypothetical protein